MEKNLELSEIVKNHYITELQKHLEKESKKFTDNFIMLLNERLQIKANTIHKPSEIRPQFNLTIIYDKEKKEKNEDDIVL